MTEDVLVSIKGLQLMSQEQNDEVEVVTRGHYLKKGEKHYISYEEALEGTDETIQSLIKLDDSGMEVTKKGFTNVHMVFEKDKKNLTCYNTPFGNLMVGILATNVAVDSTEEKLDVTVNYVLDVNYEHMADCTIHMQVQPREHGEILLQN